MTIGLILVISLFILSPAFISAKEFQCLSQPWSIRAGDPRGFDYVNNYNNKTCNDTCVQYKCIIEDDIIVMGGGCYQEYENVCRYVPTILKEKIKRNMEYFRYANSSLIFASNATEWGGSDEYKRLIELNPAADRTFGAHLKTQWNGKEVVDWQPKFRTPRNIKSSVQCGVKQSCKPGSKFDKPDTTEYTETKTSTACVSYMCTVDGKKIMSGSGTFEEFDKACGNVADSDKKVVKHNIKNSFHYGSNFVVASCSHDDNCSDLELKRYTYINKEAFDPFLNNIDKSYQEECDHQPLTTQQPIIYENETAVQSSTPNSSFNDLLIKMEEVETYLLNSDNSTVRNVASNSTVGNGSPSIDSKLHGLISFGLILIYLW